MASVIDRRRLTRISAEELLPILRWIDAYTNARKVSPSVREIQDAFGYGSTQSAWRRLVLLKSRNWLTWQARTSRSLVVTDAGRAALGAA